jgi:hypothetical protein
VDKFPFIKCKTGSRVEKLSKTVNGHVFLLLLGSYYKYSTYL